MLKNQNKIVQLYNSGRINDCIVLAHKSLKKNPDDLFFINFLIKIYLNINNIDYALFYFNRSMSVDDKQKDILFNYSVFLDSIGDHDNAIKTINKYLTLFSFDENALINKGYFLRNASRFDEAIDSFKSALNINKKNYNIYSSIAYIYYITNNFELAVNFYNKAIILNPNLAALYLGRGLACLSSNDFDNALFDFNQAIAINPNLHEAFLSRGLIFYRLKKYNNCIDDYNQSIKLKPDYLEAYHNRGILFNSLGEHYAAIDEFKKILFYDKNNYESYLNIANSFKYLREYDNAISNYEISISLNKNYYPAYWNLSSVLLKNKCMKLGWEYHEYRIKINSYKNNLINGLPIWKIDSDISNKIVLIHPDGGFGDFIQFYRFVLIALNLCKKIILRCPRELIDLIKLNNSYENLEIIDLDKEIPHFDFQCLIMSLPYLTNTEANYALELIPYIKLNQNFSIKLSEPINNEITPNIGIFWEGAKRDELDSIAGQNRSISLTNLKDIFNLPFRFHVLQPTISDGDAKTLATYSNIATYNDHINNFLDTASIIEQLDLIISIDTSLVHLCGAMNKPTWALLPYINDYRWGDDEQVYSPWYDSVKIFRQKNYFDWGDTITSLKDNLIKFYRFQYES